MLLTLGHICGINVLASNMTISVHSQGSEFPSIDKGFTSTFVKGEKEQDSCTAVGCGGIASVACPCIVFSPATHARRCNPAQAQ